MATGRSRTVTKSKTRREKSKRMKAQQPGQKTWLKTSSGVSFRSDAMTRRDDTFGCIGDAVDLGSRCLLTLNQKSDLSFVRFHTSDVRAALNTQNVKKIVFQAYRKLERTSILSCYCCDVYNNYRSCLSSISTQASQKTKIAILQQLKIFSYIFF